MNIPIDAMLADPECEPGIIEDALKDFNPDWKEGDPLATVYIVRGGTGSGADVRDWLVCAFLDWDKADALRAQLDQWCKDNGVASGAARIPYAKRESLKCLLDPHFECDYYGTWYEVIEIELRG